jgi:hypothetical protein
MRGRVATAIVAASLLAVVHQASATWMGGGPYAGIVTSLAADPERPNVLFAGVGTGEVYVSTDAGRSWSPTGPGLVIDPNSAFAQVAIAIDPVTPSTIYAATPTGVFKSVDGGASWTATGLDSAQQLAIDPLTPTTIYASSEGSGLFKSTDGGTSWTKTGLASKYCFGDPCTTDWVDEVAIDPRSPSTLYARIPSDIARSDDGGQSWTYLDVQSHMLGYALHLLDHFPFTAGLVVDAQAPSRIFVGAFGLYASEDDGDSWRRVSPDLNAGLDLISALAVDSSTPDVVYMATPSDVFAKRAGTPCSIPLDLDAHSEKGFPRALLLAGGMLYAATSEKGVLRIDVATIPLDEPPTVLQRTRV